MDPGLSGLQPETDAYLAFWLAGQSLPPACCLKTERKTL